MHEEAEVSITGKSVPDLDAKSLELTQLETKPDRLLGQGHIRVVILMNGLFAVCVAAALVRKTIL